MHKTIERLDALIQKLQAERRAKLAEVQAACQHKNLAACDCSPGSYYRDNLPPMRVCEDCGMTEDGWGCGYLVLTGERVRFVERNDIYRMRAGLALRDEHKGPLLRCETTVQQLIAQEAAR